MKIFKNFIKKRDFSEFQDFFFENFIKNMYFVLTTTKFFTYQPEIPRKHQNLKNLKVTLQQEKTFRKST